MRNAVTLVVMCFRWAMAIRCQLKILQLQFSGNLVVVIPNNVFRVRLFLQILENVVPSLIIADAISSFHIIVDIHWIALQSSQFIQLDFLLEVEAVRRAMRRFLQATSQLHLRWFQPHLIAERD